MSNSRKFCSVPECRKRGGRMFTFPRDIKVRNEWKVLCKIERQVSLTMYVCECHFDSSDLYCTPKGLTRVLKGAKPSKSLPTLNKGYSQCLFKRRSDMKNCALGCQLTHNSLHFFPRNKHRRMHWQLLCRLIETASRNTVICDRHFLDRDFHHRDSSKVLKRSAKPSQHLPTDVDYSNDCTSGKLHNVAAWNMLVSENFDQLVCCMNYSGERTTVFCGECRDIGVWICSSKECSKGNVLNNGMSNGAFECSNNILEGVFSATEGSSTKLRSCNGASTLPPNNHSLIVSFTNELLSMFFFGVSNSLLDSLTKLVMDSCEVANSSFLPIKERVALTLCKLRLNLSFSCISKLFHVKNHSCRIQFLDTLKLLSKVLKCCVYWPSKEEVLCGMPKTFHNFEDTRVILDYVEIAVSSVSCSSCYHALSSPNSIEQSVKALLGLAPSGLITYVSKVHGGKTTFSQIFSESDLFFRNMIDPYLDAIMADKELQIDKICDRKFMRVYRPSVLGNNTVSCGVSAESTSKSALLYVENTIKKMKEFLIFESTLCSSMIPFADDIIVIVAGILNLQCKKPLELIQV